MPVIGPIKRKDLIHFLKKLNFEGPYSGSKHQYMIKEKLVLTIPNPHQSDIGRELLIKILNQAKIPRTDWEKL
jgi:predicted RNA binding protein YcfA (HicA-like mRNA interferase family)